MDKPNNPPAFPVLVERQTSSDPLATPKKVQLEGMTLRDWFAGQCIAGFCAEYMVSLHTDNAATMARVSYQMADAMLAEREAGQ